MNKKCPRCGFKGEMADDKCPICDLHIEPHSIKPIELIIIFAILAVGIIAIGLSAYWYVRNNLLDGDLNGEVFIVTKGGQTLRLALVEIRAIPQADFERYEVLKNEEAEREKQRILLVLDNAKRKMEFSPYPSILPADYYQARQDFAELRSVHFYWKGLPLGTHQTKTDVNGEFTFRLKRNASMLIAARASRTLLTKEENYCWFIPVNLEGKDTMKISLNNDNMFWIPRFDE